MSKKSQHNNILLAVIGFTAVVILVGVIGFFTLEQKDDTIQGEVEVSEYRVSCKLPGRVVELRVKEGDYVHVGDTLAILEVPEMKSQEQMLQATNARSRFRVPSSWFSRQQPPLPSPRKPTTACRTSITRASSAVRSATRPSLPTRLQRLRWQQPEASMRWRRTVHVSRRSAWQPTTHRLRRVPWM